MRWDALVLEALADPDHSVDRAAVQGGLAAPAVILDPLAGGTRRAGPHPARPPRWSEDALVRTTDVGHVDGHGTPHGDLGPLARRPPGARSRPAVTDRIRHIAHLGVRTRDFAFAVHRLPPPADEFRVDLTAPSGEVWSWGPEDAAQTVTGPAYDFCLLVTQRVNRADTPLVSVGPDADTWLSIAQCFAGPPGEGREPR